MSSTSIAPALSKTKLEILDAAERLFATHGFKATSLRAITTEAQANLAAVNYHFSSKDALILAVLRRRIQPLNQERLALLERFGNEAGGEALPVEKILEALFRPPIESVARGAKGGRYFMRLVTQCLAEPGAYLQPLIEEEFAEKNQKFHTAIKRSMPRLSDEEVYWRLHFAIGVFLHAIANARVLELASGGRCRVTSVEETLRKIISFCSAGIKQRERQEEKNE